MAADKITDFSRLSINTATTKVQFGFADAVKHYKSAGISGISPWRDQVAAIGVDEAAKMIRDYDMTVTGYCRGGFFPYMDAGHKQRNVDDNLKTIDEAAALGAECVVLVCGGLPDTVPGEKPGTFKNISAARDMVAEGIAAVLDHAKSCNMPLAIEPLHPMYAGDRSVITTLQEANDICEDLGEGVGVAIDVFHVWWDPNLEREIKRAGRNKSILAFHICDWKIPTMDLLLDRGMMGDGVIDIPYIRSLVEAEGYTGFHEVEIFSKDDWWTRDGDEVINVCKERYLTAV